MNLIDTFLATSQFCFKSEFCPWLQSLLKQIEHLQIIAPKTLDLFYLSKLKLSHRWSERYSNYTVY